MTIEFYPPARLTDCNGLTLFTGKAFVNLQDGSAEFFPLKTANDEMILRGEKLMVEGIGSFSVSNIKRCAAFRIDQANPHYEMEVRRS